MGEGGISTAMNRNGEKLGWTGGWIGSFIWILIFAIACFVKGYAVYGAIGVIVFSIALLMILKFSPWRYPDTKYWKLMLPIYVLFMGSVIFVVYVLTGFNDLGRIQYCLWLIPCFTPLFIMGNKTWDEFSL